MPDQPLNWLDDDQHGQSGPRYRLVGEEDGSWSVYDTRTDLPVVWEDKMMVHMTFDEADDMVETMNQIAQSARSY